MTAFQPVINRSHIAAIERDTTFTLADLDYELPDGLIAQHPLPRRDASRLLTLNRATGEIHDRSLIELPGLLRPGDLLMLNDTKVLPARFAARRKTGGKVGGLFVREVSPTEWEVMLDGSRRLRVGESLSVTIREQEDVATFELLQTCGRGLWRVGVSASGSPAQILDLFGMTPLPPYIRRDGSDPGTEIVDRSRYQTVYARRPGAIAAPTAGLHLTHDLLDQIRASGVDTSFVTLHVGMGTFKPIDVEQVSQHTMHTEWYELNQAAAEAVRCCRQRSGRVVAVGTTTVRVLESVATNPFDARSVSASTGETGLFIHPPYEFRVVDALLTNFHLPQSTLLAMVMAFAGVDNIRRAYAHAIEQRYRFYSYGDAMLIR